MAEILKAHELPQQQQAPEALTHTNVPRTVWQIRTPREASANDETYDGAISAASEGEPEWVWNTQEKEAPTPRAIVEGAAKIWASKLIFPQWPQAPHTYSRLVSAMEDVRRAANDVTYVDAA